MTIRPAIKQFLIEAGVLALAICMCLAVMQLHLWHARGNALSVRAGGMSTVIHELQNRPIQNLPVQELPTGLLS